MYDVSMIDGHIDEPKMTDDDVIKALECCNLRHYHGCKGCAYFADKKCIEYLAFDALVLIKRQKAEIEKLLKVIFKKEELAQTLHKEHQKTVDELQFATAEIERLNKLLIEKYKQNDNLHEYLQYTKAEAYKEFADDLKQDIKNHRLEMNLNGLKGTHRTDEMTYQTIIDYIDYLLEEKAGNDHA